jgi:hypothetical protein
LLPAIAWSGDWTDPTPDELAMREGSIEPGADAEALLWEVTMDDDPQGGRRNIVFDHDPRVKIPPEAGAQKYSDISIHYPKGWGDSLVSARSVAPDGTVSVLASNAVFKTTVTKTADEELQSTTFAVPNVVVGSVLEYRYRETRYDWLYGGMLLPLQLDIPVWLVRYNIRPIATTAFSMRNVVFNTTITPFQRRAGGFYTAMAKRLPALVREPYMPPIDQVRASMLVYYAVETPGAPDEYWQQRGRESTGRFDSRVHPNGAIRALAAEVAPKGAPAEARLRLLFDWCRRNIRNLDQEAREGRPPDRKQKENDKAADVLDRRAGTAEDVNLLFASLARAAGFDVRLARTSSRDSRYFDPATRVDVFLDDELTAVRLDGAWRFFDPGALPVAFGSLRWQNEGAAALLCDGSKSAIIETPLSPPEFSLQTRTARLKLNAEGTLEGEVRMRLAGHMNSSRRAREAGESLTQREEHVTAWLQRGLPTAQVTNERIAEDLPDTTTAYEWTAHVRIPDYATRVGKRLLIQPSVFEVGRAAIFSASKRRHPVCFSYPWAELDTVRIELPDGYAVDAASQPAPMSIPGIGHYTASMRMSPDAREVIYVRTSRFGEGGTICFPADSYSGVKKVFDAFRERDDVTLTLFDPADME